MTNDTLIKILQATNNASVIKIYLYTQIFLENHPDTKIIIDDSWSREYLCYLSNATNISEKNLYRYLKVLVSNDLLNGPTNNTAIKNNNCTSPIKKEAELSDDDIDW